jgi:hypothetical protein
MAEMPNSLKSMVYLQHDGVGTSALPGAFPKSRIAVANHSGWALCADSRCIEGVIYISYSSDARNYRAAQ